MQIGVFENIGDHSRVSEQSGFGDAAMPSVGGEIALADALERAQFGTGVDGAAFACGLVRPGLLT